MPKLRAILVLIGFLGVTAICMPVQAILLRLAPGAARRFQTLYFQMVCAVVGIRIHRRGALATGSAILVASNHTSYFDIVILGTLGPISFISKSEVADWPLFGTLARLARTVFVERERRAKTAQHRDMIQSRLFDGDSLVLFPEGTSSDGNRVLPFKSALIGAAQPPRRASDGDVREIRVQPVTVAYTHLHGLPMGRYFRPFFAWYGDMEMVPHLWEAFCLGPFDVTVEVHAPVGFGDFASRREMTAHCETVVADGLSRALAGRDVPVLPRP